MCSCSLNVRVSARTCAAALAWLAFGASAAIAQTFSNSTLIRIPASGTGPGPASPYPSNIVVSGLTRPVGDVSVNLFGLTHTFPADIGVLLVGPSGENVVLMANVGGSCDLTGVNVQFADGAPPLTTDCIAAGTHSPTILGNPTFDPPAPASPYGNALSLFSGTNGNGTWSLFVIDDAFLDSGSIAGGWSITFAQPKVTYQGRLEQNATDLNGTADFVFSLFDSSTGGSALEAIAVNNVHVADGLFTVELPFNCALFDGTSRWLEILVRSPAGLGFFTLLSDRQPLNSAPLALHARTAGLATAALSAANATHAETASTASIATFANNADSADFAIAAGSADTADLATAATRLDAPDGSPTGVVVVSNGGDVGIPIATVGNKLSVFGDTHLTGDVALGPNLLSAQTLLHVSSGTSGATVQTGADLLVESFDACYINLATQNNNEHGVTFGSPAGSVHGGIYYKNSVGMDFRTGNDASRMTINSSGNVGIGVGVSGGSIDARLHVAGGAASTRPLKVDRTGSDGELIAFARDDSLIGNITLAAGVVSYNAFTGSHWAWLDRSLERGTLVSMTGDNRRAGTSAGEGEVIYGARRTTIANDPACLGAYLAPAAALSDEMPHDCHQIMAVGNGEMWVVNTGRDVQPGDYLISSDAPGCAMLDDPARFPVGHVIARAAEAVAWKDVFVSANGPQQRRISVLFVNFIRTVAADDGMGARVQTLEAENAALRARLEQIERQLMHGSLGK